MTQQPHPLRCETCSHYGGHICYEQHNRMSCIELTLIEMVGCASHSSRPTSPAEEKPCDHCDFQEIENRIHTAYEQGAKNERERVLDELKSRVQEQEKYCNDKGDSDENYVTANGWYARCFQCAEIVGIIESLRREGEPR